MTDTGIAVMLVGVIGGLALLSEHMAGKLFEINADLKRFDAEHPRTDATVHDIRRGAR